MILSTFLIYFFSKSIFFATLSLFSIEYTEESGIYSLYRLIWIALIGAISLYFLLSRLNNHNLNIQISNAKILVMASVLFAGQIVSYLLLNGSQVVLQTMIYFLSISLPAILLSLTVRNDHKKDIFQKFNSVNVFLTLTFAIAVIRSSGGSLASFSNIAGGDHLMIGYTMAYLFPYNFMKIISSSRFSAKVFYAALLLINVLIIGLSGARGAGVAIIICLLILFYKYVVKKRRVLIFSAISVIIGFVGFQVLKSNPNTATAFWRFIYTFDNGIEDASSGRTELYNIALERFKDSPIFGNGIGSFGDSLNMYIYPHNLFLEVLHDFGLIGALILGSIMFVAVRKMIFLFKQQNNYSYHFISFLFIVSITSLMLSGSYLVNPQFWMSFILLMTVRPLKNPAEVKAL